MEDTGNIPAKFRKNNKPFGNYFLSLLRCVFGFYDLPQLQLNVLQCHFFEIPIGLSL